jgi:ABC-type phosphate transport system permease subunit
MLWRLYGEDGYALEVFNAVGETMAVVMVPVSMVKPLTKNELLQVRPLSTLEQHS